MDNKLISSALLMQKLACHMAFIVKGKDAFIRNILLTFFAKGHLLIEDIPGVGKTTAIKTLAKLISGIDSKRIQCTPDLLPYDITGVEIYDTTTATFRFVKGPIFTNILLVDEINRTTPKTQSAMLEAMAEAQVTVAGIGYSLSSLFFVAATQNPIESEGAYPLPVAELDRFLMKIGPGYPAFVDECAIVKDDPSLSILPYLEPVVSCDEIISIMNACSEVFCDDKLIALAVAIAKESREHHAIIMGVSPRAVIALIKVSKVLALFSNRDYVIDTDITTLAPLVYHHRIILSDRRLNAMHIIDEIVKTAINQLAF